MMFFPYRRNADERIRHLGRGDDDVYQRASLIASRVRSGQIYPLEVRVAAYLGDPAALIYMDGDDELDGEFSSKEELSQRYSIFVATPVTEALQYLYSAWLNSGSQDVTRFLLWNAAGLDFVERVAPLCDGILVHRTLPMFDDQHYQAIAAAREVVVLRRKYVRISGLRHSLRPANYSELSREEKREIRQSRRQQRQQLRAQEEEARVAYHRAVENLDPLVYYLNQALEVLSETTIMGDPPRSALYAICIAVRPLSNIRVNNQQTAIDQAARWAANARVDYNAEDDAPERLAEIEWQTQRLCQYLLGDVDF